MNLHDSSCWSELHLIIVDIRLVRPELRLDALLLQLCLLLLLCTLQMEEEQDGKKSNQDVA